MAYQLKKIRFQGRECRILLQNENGPCPLLAAANCLLLQDRVSLPASALRNNVASLSDLTNVLANFALSQHEQEQENLLHISSDTTGEQSGGQEEQDDHDRIRAAQSHFQLNELLQLIPKLQDGMDVNPKFTAGITGYEYTSQLTCFDLWKVTLVHGWLLEKNNHASAAAPDDDDDGSSSDNNDFYEAIRDKTYNELVEMVIRGHDARDKVQQVQAQLNELQQQQVVQQAPASQQPGPPPDLLSGDYDIVDTEIVDTAAVPSPEQKRMIQDLQDKLDIYASAASMSARVDYFLQSTCHQLTLYGLQTLQSDLKANQVVVFFRNNHFSTLTKNEMDGHLYLLVTDLGYCNTPLVVWEKLDNISGDTEYVNSDFCKPAPVTGDNIAMTEPGIATSLSPEQLLAQASQNDADFQLALQLSKQHQQQQYQQSSSLSGSAATAAAASAAAAGGQRVEVGIPVSPPRPMPGGGTIVALPPAPGCNPPSTATAAQTQAAMTQEAADRLLAMQLAASEEQQQQQQGAAYTNNHRDYYSNDTTADASYHLARQLQEEENQQAAARRQAQAQRQQQLGAAASAAATTANRNQRTATTLSSSTSSNNSNCIIS